MWALLWQQNVKKQYRRSHIIYENCLPKLFKTRKEARLYSNTRFGYIKTRKDLRNWPFYWRMPKTVRVEIKEKYDKNDL